MGSRYTTEERIAQHEARLSDLRAKAAKERRRDDARRKIIVGSTLLSLIRDDDKAATWLADKLDRHCTRSNDRMFLALPVQRPDEEGRDGEVLDLAGVMARLRED